MLRTILEYLFIILTIFYIVSLIQLNYYPSYTELSNLNLRQLRYQVKDLEKLVQKSQNEVAALQAELDKLKKKEKNAVTYVAATGMFATFIPSWKRKFQQLSPEGEWPNSIAILVFVCNRPKAIKNHLQKLLRYRPSREKFPVIISQDCDDVKVKNVVDEFGSEVHYIKHQSGEKAKITVLPGHGRYFSYYKIARHYRLGLSHVFDKLNYSTVIITEDDLDIAPDFFEYFSATRHLLEIDKTLYCVSAWNDNGKPYLIDMNQPELLHRTDFFPGLGWMMTKDLWDELRSIWPDGFWDDWIRNNTIRKNRSCIRPEISRTGMTTEGKRGASRGLFFTQHLAKIIVNDVFVKFTKFNLDYLLKENYDSAFLERVYSSTTLISIPDLLGGSISQGLHGNAIRVQYKTLDEYLQIADYLKIMRDFKEGVPRTAYMGVVTCFIKGVRIYVTPEKNTWMGYDPNWEAPPGSNDIIY